MQTDGQIFNLQKNKVFKYYQASSADPECSSQSGVSWVEKSSRYPSLHQVLPVAARIKFKVLMRV